MDVSNSVSYQQLRNSQAVIDTTGNLTHVNGSGWEDTSDEVTVTPLTDKAKLSVNISTCARKYQTSSSTYVYAGTRGIYVDDSTDTEFADTPDCSLGHRGRTDTKHSYLYGLWYALLDSLMINASGDFEVCLQDNRKSNMTQNHYQTSILVCQTP